MRGLLTGNFLLLSPSPMKNRQRTTGRPTFHRLPYLATRHVEALLLRDQSSCFRVIATVYTIRPRYTPSTRPIVRSLFTRMRENREEAKKFRVAKR